LLVSILVDIFLLVTDSLMDRVVFIKIFVIILHIYMSVNVKVFLSLRKLGVLYSLCDYPFVHR